MTALPCETDPVILALELSQEREMSDLARRELAACEVSAEGWRRLKLQSDPIVAAFENIAHYLDIWTKNPATDSAILEKIKDDVTRARRSREVAREWQQRQDAQ